MGDWRGFEEQDEEEREQGGSLVTGRLELRRVEGAFGVVLTLEEDLERKMERSKVEEKAMEVELNNGTR